MVKRSPRLLLIFAISVVFVIWFYLSLLASVSSYDCSSSVAGENGTDNQTVSDPRIYCDRRSSSKYDICFMKGDVRTRSSSSSIILYDESRDPCSPSAVVDRIRPYPRKWEVEIMETVEKINLVSASSRGALEGESNRKKHHRCDVRHSVPAVVFYTGGYTGNLYHEFNDGIVPLYITTQQYNKQVVLVVVQYKRWWFSRYSNILSQLSDYPPIDFTGDKRTHCFPEVIIGVRVHDELSVDSSKMENNKTILDFRHLIGEAFACASCDQTFKSHTTLPTGINKIHTAYRPRLVIISRQIGSRVIVNEEDLISLCNKLGFEVEIVSPAPNTNLISMYQVMNNTDVMVGVHGAALTHFLFLRPSSAFIQIVPLGNDWVSESCFGKAARKMGLKYISYPIDVEESSLCREYGENNPVVREPQKIAAERGWSVIKEVYLNGQNVSLDLQRFAMPLMEARRHVLSSRKP
ncbi:Glycosyltransferase [Zostera marina]|uniref:Glycosyltransferase n=1 Tax=Zostera marina TaxID=29655 RepID=A0A0K9PLC8_ZOSMR|nr:Glycosyltransferase [Zostera marina]